MEPGAKQAIAENAYAPSVTKPLSKTAAKLQEKPSVPQKTLQLNRNIDTKLEALKQKLKSSKKN
jgi:hypothetical protein